MGGKAGGSGRGGGGRGPMGRWAAGPETEAAGGKREPWQCLIQLREGKRRGSLIPPPGADPRKKYPDSSLIGPLLQTP